MELPAEEANRVLSYRADGDPRHLEGTRFEVIRRNVLAVLDPKKPRPEAAPLSAEELLELVPGAADVKGPHVEMVDAGAAALIIVVKNDGQMIFNTQLAPEDLLHLLEHFVEDVEEAIRHRDAGLN
jgi:hypothetical protein